LTVVLVKEEFRQENVAPKMTPTPGKTNQMLLLTTPDTKKIFPKTFMRIAVFVANKDTNQLKTIHDLKMHIRDLVRL
jgi:hypothetical protein